MCLMLKVKFLTLGFIVFSALSFLGVTSQNTRTLVTAVGVPVELRCTPPDSADYVEAHWEQQVLLTPQPTIIFSSTNKTYLNTTKYSVGAGYLLTIYNPSLADGAQYKCQDEETDRYNLLYLIVIDTINVTGLLTYHVAEQDNFGCLTTYGGPVNRQSLIGDYSRMQFRIYINDICMANKTVLSTRVDQRLVMSHRYTGEVADNGAVVSCCILDEQGIIIQQTNEHLIVKHPTLLIRIFTSLDDGNSDTFQVDDFISCAADGEPPPHISWFNNGSPDVVVSSPALHVTVEMLGHNSWTCVAQNIYNGAVYGTNETYTFIVDIESIWSIRFKYVILITFGTVCIAAILLGVICYLKFKSPKTKPMYNREMQGNMMGDL